ncbi:hypothetical protein C8R45DRAFT_947485 [Mycena sanguinolenta]|nr:hypothetical protein C8R45DRAFT_947485 [Mycena sanguinolenta]
MSILVAAVHTSSVVFSVDSSRTVLSRRFVSSQFPSQSSSLFAFTVNDGPHGSFTTVLDCMISPFLVPMCLLDWTGELVCANGTSRLVCVRSLVLKYKIYVLSLPPPLSGVSIYVEIRAAICCIKFKFKLSLQSAASAIGFAGSYRPYAPAFAPIASSKAYTPVLSNAAAATLSHSDSSANAYGLRHCHPDEITYDTVCTPTVSQVTLARIFPSRRLFVIGVRPSYNHSKVNYSNHGFLNYSQLRKFNRSGPREFLFARDNAGSFLYMSMSLQNSKGLRYGFMKRCYWSSPKVPGN